MDKLILDRIKAEVKNSEIPSNIMPLADVNGPKLLKLVPTYSANSVFMKPVQEKGKNFQQNWKK